MEGDFSQVIEYTNRVMNLQEISTDMYREARVCFRSIGRMNVVKNERKLGGYCVVEAEGSEYNR